MILPRIQPLPVTAICMPEHHKVSGEKGSVYLKGLDNFLYTRHPPQDFSVWWLLSTRKMRAVCSAQQHCGGMAFLLHLHRFTDYSPVNAVRNGTVRIHKALEETLCLITRVPSRIMILFASLLPVSVF